MNKPIYLYNSLTRSKEEFKPITSGEVRMYSCGPTVYDSAHIGNLRSYIFADTLKRVLRFNDYTVTHAMNITDVGHLVGDGDEGEDKLEVGARREGINPLDIAKKYTDQFIDDLKALNIELPDKIKSATETIEAQIEIIKLLEEKGFTYKTEAAIYFDTSKVSDYGKLTGQKRNDMLSGARPEVIVDSDKKNPQDFALWFFLVGRYESHLLHWPSPWGEGFPGWHIECSAISRALLGQPFDIHTGGVDHIGTHHTNEIAQSEAAFDQPLANYWMHNEFLLVNGGRMGKSEGNVITLKTVIEKGFSPLDFRYLCLMAHYRSKMNFTWEALERARKTRLNLVESLGVLPQLAEKDGSDTYMNILSTFNDDLDTPKAIALLHESKSKTTWWEFEPILQIGLHLNNKKPQLPETILMLFSERNQARANKDWERSDELRKNIEDLGYKVIDSPEGTKLLSES
jgi:cysteinyl-tRNA synthetase